jgi:hypothetical protein
MVELVLLACPPGSKVTACEDLLFQTCCLLR